MKLKYNLLCIYMKGERCMKKKRGVLVVGLILLFLGIGTVSACGKAKTNSSAKVSSYDVLLPKTYETESRNYPVIYVMPQDGYSIDDSQLAEKMQESMVAIIVKPAFEQGVDIHGAMSNLVKEIDFNYRTAADKKFRAIVGTGTGGYLSYILGLTNGKDSVLEESNLFSFIASIRGDFVSEENPWYATYGDVASYLEKMHGKNEAVFDGFYTYMDAPVSDVWTNMKGSTNDMGALFIGYGTTSNAHEFTVRAGEFNEAFLDESVARVANRLTGYMYADMAKGQVTLTPSTLPETEVLAKVGYAVHISKALDVLSKEEVTAEIKLTLIEPNTKEILAEVSKTEAVKGDTTYNGELSIENIVNGSYSIVQLTANVLGVDLELGTTYLNRSQEPVIEDDYQYISLSGDWYFNYTGKKDAIAVGELKAEEYQGWSIVQPGLSSWMKGFGNISDKNVSSPMGEDYFDYMIVGNGYYVKEVEIPKEFDSKDLILSIGYVDDRCEVFFNGTKVGATGMDEKGEPTNETTWAQYSYFEVDANLINYDATNTVVVRAWNDLPYGAGGWYGGPIGLYSRTAFENPKDVTAADGESRFIEETFSSAYAASALGQSGTIDNQYLIYLPEDYYETERYYPTVYLLHQFNSDHTSYRIDRVDKLFDAGVARGLFDEMIVVVPNSEENSWWAGDWEKMITEELIPLIDSEYRTSKDARYRLTAGCSMGGQGAYSVALHNPDYFSGAISFFGAFSYGEQNSPNYIASKESVEYMDYYTMYFICGNQDSYGFGVPAIELNQLLEEKGVEHGFFIENGGHDGQFYLPYFTDAFAYVRENMYQSEDAIEALLSGMISIDASDGLKVSIHFDASDGMEKYFHRIPESSYTKDANPDLVLPLIVQVIQDGKIVHEQIERDFVLTSDCKNATFQYDFTQYVDTSKHYAIEYKVAVFDRIITLDSVSVN